MPRSKGKHGKRPESVTSLSPDDRCWAYETIDKLASEYNNVNKAVREVADRKGLDWESLLGLYKRMRNSDGSIHKGRKFTVEQESIVVGTAKGFSQSAQGLQIPTLAKLVRAIDPSRSAEAARSMARRISLRNKDKVRWKKTKGLKKQRFNQTAQPLHEEFLATFADLLSTNNINAESLLNLDETRVTVIGEHRTGETLEDIDKQSPTLRELTKSKGCSYTACVTASGKVLVDFYTIPISSKDEAVIPPLPDYITSSKRARNQHETIFLFTDTGYVNGEAFEIMLNEIGRISIRDIPAGLTRCLLVDNLGVHLTDPNLAAATSNNILLAMFPANMTHFLQPCDRRIFQVYKGKLKAKMACVPSFIRNQDTDLGTKLLELALQMRGILSPPVICSSWRDTGLWPFSPELMRQNFKINCSVHDQSSEAKTARSEAISAVDLHVRAILRQHAGPETASAVKVKAQKKQAFTGPQRFPSPTA